MQIPAAKPFLKWAGGKGQLLRSISARIPDGLLNGAITRYAEPFVGSGAVFFHVTQNFQLEQTLLQDANEELVLAWQTIRDRVDPLIEELKALHCQYMLEDRQGQERLFYSVRDTFNSDRAQYDFKNPPDGGVKRSAQAIFLNRTCFNGLFRVNSRALFNVPFGKYKSPRICDAENLRRVSRLLRRVPVNCGDFESAAGFIDKNTFVYLDPPYRPISRTANFNKYAANAFGDDDQRRLAAFCRKIDARGAKLLLSNSDPRNQNPDDDFFDRLYEGFRIERVQATRNINVNPDKRSAISEILVSNY